MKIVFTKHGQETMAKRRVSHREVKRAIRDYDISEPDRDDTRRYVKGDLCVVTSTHRDKVVVITVLWRNRDQWTTEQMVKARA